MLLPPPSKNTGIECCSGNAIDATVAVPANTNGAPFIPIWLPRNFPPREATSGASVAQGPAATAQEQQIIALPMMLFIAILICCWYADITDWLCFIVLITEN